MLILRVGLLFQLHPRGEDHQTDVASAGKCRLFVVIASVPFRRRGQ